MTPEPRHLPIVPSYGAAALADLSSSLLASLDPEAPFAQNVLGLPPARRACLLIVDGLGWELLRDHPAAATFLSELARNSRPITAGFPSTTVTSLGSICTGRPPGQHGILGYQVAIPGENRLLNGLRWDARVDPVQWQPLPTVYEQAAAAGIAAVHVAQGAFRGTGLTVATMRGADFRPADSMGALAAQGATALRENDRAFVTVYHGDLDGAGHVFGVASDAWYNQLAHVDKLAELLAGALPSDRKSTRLNSSHVEISYAGFCLKKKNHELRVDELGAVLVGQALALAPAVDLAVTRRQRVRVRTLLRLADLGDGLLAHLVGVAGD